MHEQQNMHYEKSLANDSLTGKYTFHYYWEMQILEQPSFTSFESQKGHYKGHYFYFDY